MKLLAIDDNRDNLTTLKAVLADRLPEARLLTALSGPRGIELAQAEDPDVILLDIVMPGMDGYAVCRALKQDERLRSIPVLFLTALRTDRESRIKALEAGAEGFLSKPFDEVELTAQIRAMTKIKAANRMQRLEKEEFAALVAERTRALEQELEARKRAEQAIGEAEKKYRALFETMSDGIVYEDHDGKIISANPAAERLLGLSLNQMQGRTSLDPRWKAIHEDGSPFPGETHSLSVAAKTGKPAIDEVMGIYNPKSNTYVWLNVSATPEYIPGEKKPFRAYAVFRDITERKQAEDERAKQSLMLRSIIDNSGSLIYTLDTDGRFTLANRELCSLFGTTPDQIVGKYREDMIQAEVAKQHQGNDLEVIRTGKLLETQESYPQSDGIHTYLTVKFPLKRDDGMVYAVGGVSIDITERKRVEAALRESELLFRNLANAVPQIVWMTDAEGLNNYFNQQWVAYTGLTLEESYGHGWILPFHPDDRQRAWEAWQNATNTAGVYSVECRLRRADGEYRWWLIRATALQDAAGKVVRWFGTCTDIDDLKRIELQLQLAASVFGHAQEGIAITAVDGTILAVNDSFTRITGYAREEAIGQNPRILKSGRHGPEFYAAMWQALTDKGQWYGELWNRRKNGEVFPEMLGITAVRAADGTPQHYVGLFSDITAIKEHEERLVYLAHYDALTSLPNRRLLADRLQQAMAQTQRRARRHARSLAVLYLDLDGFKGVNDQHGHEIGDQLLVVIAQRMGAVLREGDTLARFGGDEFIAVLMDLEQPRDGEGVITRLLTAVADPVTIGAAELQVSASIGVTFFPQDQADADQLLRHADQAMYVAKQSGKNSYHIFDIAQDTAVKSRHASLERIRLALDRREFILYYQPKVNLRTGTVIGAEALVRWRHPESGLLRPAAFLPVIENHPLGVELGDWVLATALTQIANWRAQGFDLPISVNIGARQLQQLDFMPRLRERLAACPRIPPDRLELEILESSALGDIAQVTRTMLAVRALGVRFAIDDFGTGYSSLTYLKRLPADMIKIDQSFVRDMLDDPEDLAIIDGVIGLATAFGREVIAEGVESAAHGELLLLMGCTLAQGYYIALPMPAEDLPGWSRIWRPAASWLAPTTGASGRELFPVLLAITHHRAWIGALEACLTGSASTPPPPDEHHCHFGAWLEGEGRARWGTHRGFQESLTTHHRLHCLAEELLTWHARGETAAARDRLGELRALSDDLTGALRALIRGGNPPAESPASGDE
jgi:diguanylate cyclase (GGDEF)-like protein/PAS domain S-box-containing protein